MGTQIFHTCKLQTQERQWYNWIKSEGLRTKSANALKPIPGASRWSPNSRIQKESKKGKIPPSCAFSTQALKGLDNAYTHGGGILLDWVHWFKRYPILTQCHATSTRDLPFVLLTFHPLGGNEQDQTGGRVKGCTFTFFCKNTKTITRCWSTINSRMMEPTKKRYPISKDKGEAATRW